MTYFPDLSEYTYHHNKASGVFNVGWLDCEFPYRKGPVDDRLRDRLRELCVTRTTNQMRGAHLCNLCTEKVRERYAEWNGMRRALGSAEIRVVASSGKIYAAPTLIVHYVDEHGYLPPSEFLDALMVD